MSGLDLIATVVIAVPICLALAALGWVVARGYARKRSFRFNATTSAVVLIACAAAIYWVYHHNAGSPTGEYPALLDAYELASPQAQVAMAEVLRQARSRREIFSMSLAQRDRLLEAGGYCLRSKQSYCKSVPRGTVAEGEAVEILGNMPLARTNP